MRVFFGHYLATVVVYRVITQQRVYMLQYKLDSAGSVVSNGDLCYYMLSIPYPSVERVTST
jgi:hypothetical protein